MKPHIICHMLASLDGGLHPSRYTESPDGSRAEWSGLYEQIHNDLEGDAWIVGRVTMAEMSKAGAHPPAHAGKVERPHHFARRDAGSYAVALDASGKLHFAKPDIGGDHVVVLLGREVEDTHLAELAADGVSYVVSQTPDIDLAAMLDVLGRELGISRLLLEGGAGINGSFFAAGLVDELSLLIAPALDARAANQGVVEFGEAGLAGKMRLSLKSCQTLAHGLVQLRYAVSPG
ncbi:MULTISPECIES: RibD family protein [unclassified Mesorhizobium]|uniref:RibD family protein n=1 Tax=unclassified Mesorhizobium TaxID=325217 RepID=UPI001091C9EB|nr:MULTISPECIES: RibD family protein [unclassified Mesorhizobium]TGP87533.1 RibD family protein [Mesorhizobium sp. M8A.F.Ca.ET.218.01.1.1]TGT15550.1 RibD family protein [Mesorhizobium sp. M8A.F.Ca.ET.213.01.1.1]TIS85753.1 MAG: RibD family protein [Mesorhizobium sp.]